MKTSQCTCRCVVLPDLEAISLVDEPFCLNAPAGAWCSLTSPEVLAWLRAAWSQCTCRCVVLPDRAKELVEGDFISSQCTCRCVVLPDRKISRT